MKFNKSFWTVQVNVVHNSWNALCAQVKSASYRSWDRKLLVAYRLWGEGLVWLIGVVVCLFPANHCSSCLLMRAMAGCIVRSGIISLCQSAAIFENVKALLATSLSPVRSTKQVQDCFLCGHLLVVEASGPDVDRATNNRWQRSPAARFRPHQSRKAPQPPGFNFWEFLTGVCS